MILYQYPKKKSVYEKRIEKNNRSVEGKKFKKNLYTSITISLIIIAITFFVQEWWVVVICLVISLYNFFVSFLSYRMFIVYSSDKIYTKLYEDKIVHCQPCLLSHKIKQFDIKFEDIEYSKQGKLGEFEIHLKDKHTSEIAYISKTTKEEVDLKENIAVLKFSSVEPKLHIINNYPTQFKYLRFKNGKNI